MSNFIEEFKRGQIGKNKGLDMGPGFSAVSKHINGVSRGAVFGIASSPKVGKSTLVQYAFIIHPYLDALKKGIPIHFIFFSFEMDRILVEFNFAVYFLFLDYGIKSISLEDGITHNGETVIPLTPDYLRGKIQDDNGDIIKVKTTVEEKLKEVYEKRIIPMFGEYNKYGIRIKKGVIDFVEHKTNPTGLKNYILEWAEENGTFHYEHYTDKEGRAGKKAVGYTPNNEEAYTIIITDTIRKIPRERGFSMKENIDKYIEYSVDIRKMCSFTFVHIIHLNRDMTDVNRMRYMGDLLFPTADDIKDTGNLSEEADYIFTMMDPNDDRYKLDKHFGAILRNSAGDVIYPNMRSLHLVESRHAIAPKHFRINMEGHIKNFERLII